MGRSRGGLTSKIHALVDADGRPVTLRLSGGQVHDSREAEALLKGVDEGTTLLADKGYDSDAIRDLLAQKKGWANIPTKSNRKRQRREQRYAVEQHPVGIEESGCASGPANSSQLFERNFERS